MSATKDAMPKDIKAQPPLWVCFWSPKIERARLTDLELCLDLQAKGIWLNKQSLINQKDLSKGLEQFKYHANSERAVS